MLSSPAGSPSSNCSWGIQLHTVMHFSSYELVQISQESIPLEFTLRLKCSEIKKAKKIKIKKYLFTRCFFILTGKVFFMLVVQSNMSLS